MEYDYENKKEHIEDVIKGLNDTESIVFSADITNEEALLLQTLKEKDGKRLISPEAKTYQDFLKAYSSCSGYHIFKGDLDTLETSDVVISFGLWFQNESAESESLLRKILEAQAEFVYLHPIEDATLQSSITQFIKYEVGSEEGVAALLAYTLLEDKVLPEEIEAFLEDLDIGYLSAESNVGEEELESMYGLMDENSKVSLVIGNDLYTHPNAEQIAKLMALLERYAGVNVLCIPPEPNALGVAMICDLDATVQGRSVHYQSCKEGTYLNSNRCVQIHEEIHLSDRDGFNEMAHTLGLQGTNLMDYSKQLPEGQGFQILCEDDLKNACIYRMHPQERVRDLTLDEIDDLPVYDGAVVYTYKKGQKSLAKEGETEAVLWGSKQFAVATKLQDGDLISFKIEGVELKRVFKIDTHMKGVIALTPTFDIELSASLLSSYRFSRLAFEKINNQKIGNDDE